MSTRGPRRDGDGGANDVRSLGFNDLINSMDPHDRAVIHNQRARHARGDGRERSRSRRRVSWRDGGKNHYASPGSQLVRPTESPQSQSNNSVAYGAATAGVWSGDSVVSGAGWWGQDHRRGNINRGRPSDQWDSETDGETNSNTNSNSGGTNILSNIVENILSRWYQHFQEIEQYRKEFRESEERRSRVAGIAHFTPYRCGRRMTQEEEGWLQCNACIAADRESPETDRTISVFEELGEEFQRRTERSVDRWAAGLDRQQAEQQQQLQEEQHLSGRGLKLVQNVDAVDAKRNGCSRVGSAVFLRSLKRSSSGEPNALLTGEPQAWTGSRQSSSNNYRKSSTCLEGGLKLDAKRNGCSKAGSARSYSEDDKKRKLGVYIRFRCCQKSC